MESYTFNVEKYYSFIENNDNDEITPYELVSCIIKSYNIETFITGEMISTLLRDKKKYLNLENHFEFAAEFLVYRHLLKIGVDKNKPEIISLKEKMVRIWNEIFKE